MGLLRRRDRRKGSLVRFVRFFRAVLPLEPRLSLGRSTDERRSDSWGSTFLRFLVARPPRADTYGGLADGRSLQGGPTEAPGQAPLRWRLSCLLHSGEAGSRVQARRARTKHPAKAVARSPRLAEALSGVEATRPAHPWVIWPADARQREEATSLQRRKAMWVPRPPGRNARKVSSGDRVPQANATGAWGRDPETGPEGRRKASRGTEPVQYPGRIWKAGRGRREATPGTRAARAGRRFGTARQAFAGEAVGAT